MAKLAFDEIGVWSHTAKDYFFFQIVDKMKKLVEQNLEVKKLFRVERQVNNPGPLLKHLLLNAKRNEEEFWFNKLLLHLQTYNAAKIITVGEDATRVITKVDYDNETDL